MKYIATALLVLMTITFIACGILLWKRRKEPNDHLRPVSSAFSGFATPRLSEGRDCLQAMPSVSGEKELKPKSTSFYSLS